MQTKTEIVRLRVTPEFKQKTKEAAAAENRTVSNYIINLIDEDLKRKGQADEKHADHQ